jgi:hypothetical protein
MPPPSATPGLEISPIAVPSETVAFATVESVEGDVETGAVGIDVEGETVRLYLDDGRILAFDRREVLAALSSAMSVTAPETHPTPAPTDIPR